MPAVTGEGECGGGGAAVHTSIGNVGPGSAAVGAFLPLIGRCGTAGCCTEAGSTRCADGRVGRCGADADRCLYRNGYGIGCGRWATGTTDDAAILVIVHGHGYTGKGKCGGGSSTIDTTVADIGPGSAAVCAFLPLVGQRCAVGRNSIGFHLSGAYRRARRRLRSDRRGGIHIQCCASGIPMKRRPWLRKPRNGTGCRSCQP